MKRFLAGIWGRDKDFRPFENVDDLRQPVEEVEKKEVKKKVVKEKMVLRSSRSGRGGRGGRGGGGGRGRGGRRRGARGARGGGGRDAGRKPAGDTAHPATSNARGKGKAAVAVVGVGGAIDEEANSNPDNVAPPATAKPTAAAKKTRTIGVRQSARLIATSAASDLKTGDVDNNDLAGLPVVVVKKSTATGRRKSAKTVAPPIVFPNLSKVDDNNDFPDLPPPLKSTATGRRNSAQSSSPMLGASPARPASSDPPRASRSSNVDVNSDSDSEPPAANKRKRKSAKKHNDDDSSSGQPKRKRRRRDQMPKNFFCPGSGCDKDYEMFHHLNNHIKIHHHYLNGPISKGAYNVFARQNGWPLAIERSVAVGPSHKKKDIPDSKGKATALAQDEDASEADTEVDSQTKKPRGLGPPPKTITSSSGVGGMAGRLLRAHAEKQDAAEQRADATEESAGEKDGSDEIDDDTVLYLSEDGMKQDEGGEVSGGDDKDDRVKGNSSSPYKKSSPPYEEPNHGAESSASGGNHRSQEDWNSDAKGAPAAETSESA